MGSKMTIEKCIMCDADAKYIRHTQFAGDHPFCESCGPKEDGFMENDSYEYWTEIENETVSS